MARPKSKTTLQASAGRLSVDEKSCGYIMHQVRSVKCKMRWGELTIGKTENGMNFCLISLFKFDLISPKLGTLAKRDLKQRASFYFDEESFCGLEKGQHITKHGTKRYICIILKDQHVIFQDAVIAMTNTDHDVIQTWYRKITDAMHYMYRWKILSTADAKFLHVSKLNTSVCLSLHNSNEGLKGKILLQQQYKTKDIENVEEQHERQRDGQPCTRIIITVKAHDEKVCMILEAGKSFKDVINNANHIKPVQFDFMDYQNPNLVKVPPPPKETIAKTPDHSLDKKPNQTSNIYISNTGISADRSPSAMMRPPMVAVPRHPFSHFPINPFPVGPSMPRNGLGSTPFSPTNPFANHNQHRLPPRIPPRQPSESLKKSSDTCATFDSGIYTSNTAQSTTQNLSNAHVTNGSMTADTSSPYVNMVSISESKLDDGIKQENENVPPKIDISAPELPSRDFATANHTVDLIERAIQDQNLPPIDLEAGRPAYQNSMAVEVTIDLVLNQNHGENIDVSLGLPYSVYMAIVLGLEKDSVAEGDWRGLASELAMSFDDVRQIEAATQHRERLYPAHIVMVHWLRTQAPYPFSRLFLKRLAQRMNRMDLAELIPLNEDEDKKRSNNGHK